MGESRVIQIAKLTDLPPGTMMSVTVAGEAVLLVNLDGTVMAMQGICSHEEAELEEGLILDDSLVCWLHGSRFSILTGEVLDPPAQLPLIMYTVQIRDGWVSLEIPSAGISVNSEIR